MTMQERRVVRGGLVAHAMRFGRGLVPRKSFLEPLIRAVAAVAIVLCVACGREGDKGRISAGPAAMGTAVLGGNAAGTNGESGTPVADARDTPMDYTPPPDSLIPHDELGASIRRGLSLVTHTTDSLPKYAPGSLQCSSCHIDAGRR
ncbi:MAG: hypothetical protein NVS4B3_27320 [Gemmatimonadaceae bacterium]